MIDDVHLIPCYKMYKQIVSLSDILGLLFIDQLNIEAIH